MLYRQLLLSIILSLIFLFPLYLVFINSFKFESDILNNPASFPELYINDVRTFASENYSS